MRWEGIKQNMEVRHESLKMATLIHLRTTSGTQSPVKAPAQNTQGKCLVFLPGLAKDPAGLFSLTVWRTRKIWQLILRGRPAGAGEGDEEQGVVGRTQ